jgi:hypothetical protein
MGGDTVTTEEETCFWIIRFLGTTEEEKQICSNHESDYCDSFVPLHCKKCSLFKEA